MNQSLQHVDFAAAPLQAASDADRRVKRRRLLILFAGTVSLSGLVYGGWLLFFGARSVSTEDAYTAVEVAQITPLVSGAIVAVKVIDTQAVEAGDTLVVLDDTDERIALNQAEANLSVARRHVQQLVAHDTNLGAQLDLRSHEIRSARADLTKAHADLEKAVLDAQRRRNLIAVGAVSQEELSDSETRLREAQAAVEQAEARIRVAIAAESAAVGARRANAALIADSDVDANPEVRAAAARLQQATINLVRTVIKAPVAGIVTQRAAEVGQHVQAGMRLMSVVPTHSIYVDANFKEGQLRNVQPGQHARLTSDLYGDDVVFDGRIQGFAGGTGAAFAAIPAQNATGNWIKVVQRLPVRVQLDPRQLAQHPLRVGLSMTVRVDLTSAE